MLALPIIHSSSVGRGSVPYIDGMPEINPCKSANCTPWAYGFCASHSAKVAATLHRHLWPKRLWPVFPGSLFRFRLVGAHFPPTLWGLAARNRGFLISCRGGGGGNTATERRPFVLEQFLWSQQQAEHRRRCAVEAWTFAKRLSWVPALTESQS